MGKRRERFGATETWGHRGSKRKSTGAELMAFARATWEQDPNVTINGRDGMQERLRHRFQRCLPDQQLVKLRSELRNPNTPKTTPKPVAETKPQRHLSAVPDAFTKLAPPTAHELADELVNGTETMGGKKKLDMGLASDRRDGYTERFQWVVERFRSDPGLTNQKILAEHEKLFGHKCSTYTLTKARRKLGIGKSTEGATIRKRAAIEYFAANPRASANDLQAYLREKFGKGIGAGFVAPLRKKGLAKAARAVRNGTPIAPAPAPAPAPTTTAPTGNEDQQVIAAMELLLEAVPGLYALQLDVATDAQGEKQRSLTFRIHRDEKVTF